MDQKVHPPTVPHYHTACKRCGQTIIMAQSIFPPHSWGPRELNGQGHDCPQRDVRPVPVPLTDDQQW
jgi:hypothetical protein